MPCNHPECDGFCECRDQAGFFVHCKNDRGELKYFKVDHEVLNYIVLMESSIRSFFCTDMFKSFEDLLRQYPERFLSDDKEL